MTKAGSSRTDIRHARGRREGSALLIALLALAGLSILGLSLMLVTETELQMSNDERLRKQALYAAEAGIEHAMIFLRGVDTEVYGFNQTPYQRGLLSGHPSNDWPSPAVPPDDTKSWNEPVTPSENLYDPNYSWKAPGLARKGNILWFCVSDSRCNLKPWFVSGWTSKPTINYSMRDIPFEKSAGLGAPIFDVGMFKSRYTVYVKSNMDDALDNKVEPPPFNINQPSYEWDSDKTIVLTSEGIVDVGDPAAASTYYKVVRTVEVTVATSFKQECNDHQNVGGGGGTGNRTTCNQVDVINTDPTIGTKSRNVDWK